MTHQNNKPLVVIVGPTASGKTGLAIEIAKKFNGEVISADSRAIYRGLDIGTAKPSKEEQQGVQHWGIDLVNPGERFTAADFKQYAEGKIADIRRRGRLPIIAGGTGLYVDSVLYDYKFTSRSNDIEMRNKLEKMTHDELLQICLSRKIDLPENYKNKRYVINSILRAGEKPEKKRSILDNTILVGIKTDREVLRDRIKKRSKDIVKKATIDEAIKSAEKWGWENEAMTGNIYPLIKKHLVGELAKEEVGQKFCTLDWKLAKRQLTWFRRNKDIVWLDLDEAYRYIEKKLAP